MDEMMRGQRGWRELAILGDKMDKFSGMIEGLIWSPKGSEVNEHIDDWPSEEIRRNDADAHGDPANCSIPHSEQIRPTQIRVQVYRRLGKHSAWVTILALFSPFTAMVFFMRTAGQRVHGPHSDYHGPNSGSTACVAIIRNNQIVVANAGDSRCVLCKKGQAYDLSKDHKPDLEVEKERILKAGGFIQFGRVNGSLNLARAIGDVEFKQNKFLPADRQIITANPDITIVELCDDDEFLVLACDGIWDCMTSQQLVEYVREQLKTESKLSVVCERVFDRCLAPSAGGEGCDNMTMILVQLKKPVDIDASVGDQPLSSDQPSKTETETDRSSVETESK
uniref:PPM-type phosphatase domain-containing protein n=1 Tax=Fagus sylvatica TaxID=28930 RepID=A0A2N9HYA3_FAGSY